MVEKTPLTIATNTIKYLEINLSYMQKVYEEKSETFLRDPKYDGTKRHTLLLDRTTQQHKDIVNLEIYHNINKNMHTLFLTN